MFLQKALILDVCIGSKYASGFKYQMKAVSIFVVKILEK